MHQANLITTAWLSLYLFALTSCSTHYSMPLFGTSTRRHDHDFLTGSDPFATPIPLGSNHLTEYTSEVVPSLAPGVNAKHAGVLLPNITDGFTGTNPDVGAIIEGRPVPRWGATR